MLKLNHHSFTKGCLVSKTKFQSGFVHLLIILLLVVALAGTLGFVYWQNFMQPKQTNVIDTNKSKDKTVTANEISINPSGKNPITFSYPKSWTIEQKKTDGIDTIHSVTDKYNGSDIVKISSPSGDIYISINNYVHPGGFGFECSEAETNKYVSLKPTALDSYSGYSYFEAIVHNTYNNDYFYDSYLADNSGKIALTDLISNGYCAAHAQNTVTRIPYIDIDSPGEYSVWNANIKSTDFLNSDGSTKNASDTTSINTLLNSAEFKTARDILLSAEYTK